jgi:hypothetical protein
MYFGLSNREIAATGLDHGFGVSGEALQEECISVGTGLSLYNPLATKVRATKVRATKVRATKVRATKVRATKVRATKVRATKVRATKVRATKVRATKVRATKVRATKVRATFYSGYDRFAYSDCSLGCVQNGAGKTMLNLNHWWFPLRFE